MSYVYADLVRPDILRMIPVDGSVIGSVGCGAAATEAVLVGQGRQVHGVDISPEAIAVAKTRLTSARVISPDEREPFGPESLDGLILADVIEHIPLAWDALASLSCAVKPGGWIVISVPNMRSIPVLVRFVFQGDWPEHGAGIFDRTHLQVITRRRLIRWCDSAGLHIERWFTRYDPNVPWRQRLFTICNIATLKRFNEWFMYQHQALARRHSPNDESGRAAAPVNRAIS